MVRTLSIFTTLALLCISVLSRPALSAVDPGTVYAVANLITNFLKKDPGNPTAKIIEANNDLLKQVHSRLDGIENGIAEILMQVADLPQHMFEQNVAALKNKTGNEVHAIAVTFLRRLKQLEAASKDITLSDDLYKETLDDYRAFLRTAKNDIAQKAEELAIAPGRSGLGALALITAAYTEIAMENEYRLRFGNSTSAVEIGAERYITLLKYATDKQYFGSLGYLSSNLKEKILRQPLINKWRKFQSPTIKALGDPITNKTRVSWKQNPEQSLHEVLKQISGTWWVTCSTLRRGQSLLSSKVGVLEFKISKGLSGHSLDFSSSTAIGLPSVDGSCPAHEDGYMNLANAVNNITPKNARSLISLTDVLISIEQIRDAALNAIKRLEEVKNGKYDAITARNVIETSPRLLPNLMASIAEIERFEAQRGAQVYKDRMIAKRLEIKKLMLKQDKNIQAAFDKAQSAAKYNKTLEYITIVGALYDAYHKVDRLIDENNKEDTKKTLQHSIDEIEKEIKRTPANVDFFNVADAFFQQVSWWGGAYNAKIQSQLMANARSKKAAAIPKGQSKSYYVIIRGNKFWAYEEVTGGPQIRPGDASSHGPVKIYGTK